MAAGSEHYPADSRGPRPLELHGFRAGDAQIIVLAGELDLVTVGEFTLAIDVAELTSARFIVVDLRKLEFIDSSGLRGIVAAQRRLEARLILVRGSPSVHRVFELCGLARPIGFVDRPPHEDEAADIVGSANRSPLHGDAPPVGSAANSRGDSRRAGRAVLAGAIRDARSRPRVGNGPGA